jgi:ankyrin repeat protein
MRTRIVVLCVALYIACIAVGAQEPQDKLYSAIRSNDLGQMKALLDGGVSANEAGPEGITPLMAAAEVGSLDAMKLLIDRRADVNAKSTYGSTALMWSVTDPKKVRLLLDHGADVNVAARSGRTALIIASFANPSAEVVRMLLAKGANVAVMDQRKVTPLNAATFGNDTATVRLLLEASADVNTADTFIGLTPLINASGNRNLEAVKLLLAKGANVNAVSKTEGLPRIQTGIVEFGGWTPLLMAVPFGPPDIAKTLIDAGAKVNVQDYRGFSPLMLAAANDRANPEIVRLLLSHNADKQPKTRAGETASEWASKFNEATVIRAMGGAPKTDVANAALPAQSPDVRTAVQRSVSLLERATSQFFAKGNCFASTNNPPQLSPSAPRVRKGSRSMRRRRSSARPRSLRHSTDLNSRERLRSVAPTTICTWRKHSLTVVTRRIARPTFLPRISPLIKAATAVGICRDTRALRFRTTIFRAPQWRFKR